MTKLNHWKDANLDKTQYRPKFPDSSFIHISDLVNPESGKTYREENAEKVHTIPVGALVEVDHEDCEYSGVRLFVVHHSRDCDQTPLYNLALNPNDTELNRPDFYIHKWYNGFSKDSLTMIRMPEEQDNEPQP